MRAGPPPRIVAVVLLAAGVWFDPAGARAQELPAKEQAQALGSFLKLGLPDARGGKWVKARLADGHSGDGLLLPGGDEAGYSGNAWLVREEKNGTVELIMDHTRRVRAQRVKGEDEEETAGALPAVQIQPADLDADLQKLAAALKPSGAKNRNSVRVGDDYIDSDEAPAAMAAGALLFCAQLQQQGRGAQVATLLPAVLAFAPAPADALDFALSLLADDRLRQLTDAFLEKRDGAAYAQGIEKLAGDFPRGWRKRAAALFLARRVREQKPAPEADDAGAKKAAVLLLALKSDQLQALPMNSNWLIPADGPAQDGSSGRRYRGRRMVVEDSEGAPPGGPAAAFFAERRTAFAAVARLLDDQRFVALRRGEVSGSGSSYISSDAKPAERLRQQYNGLDRPVELREIAWALVSQILPDRLRSEIDDHETGRAEKVLAWFQTVAALSDDALAWTALRQSDSASDSDFGTALTFLVTKGNADSQKLLQEVFLDPAVWSRGSDEMLGQLETYVGKLGPAGAAFGEKLRPIVAAAIKARNAEQRENLASYQASEDQRKMMAEQLKMLERQAAGELKKFDQIFKPQGLPEMLAELAAADKESSMEIWETLQGELGKVPWPQAEALLFQTAPKAREPAVRTGILTLLLQRGMGGGDGKKPAAIAPDAPTRAALETLLADATPLPEPIQWAPAAETVADFTALAFVLPRLPETDSTRWQEFMGKLPEFAIGWLKTHARALAAGQPAPPMPDAQRVPAGRAEAIVAEVAALAPEKVLAALLAKTPDEQAAAADHLGKLAAWPPALLSARLTVVGSQSDKGDVAKSFNADRWKGRRLDEALSQEIAAAVEKSGLEGRACMVGVAPVGLLGGVKIILQSRGGGGNVSAQDLARAKVPLLEGKPPPVAILASFFVMQSAARPQPVIFASALWKDPEHTRAWREKFARPADPAAKPESPEGASARFRQQGFPGQNNDPAPFDNAMRDLLSGQPAARGQFGLWWTARPVKDAKDDDDN